MNFCIAVVNNVVKNNVEMFQGLNFKEAATGEVLWQKVFLKISQNLQENTCVRFSFLIMLQALQFYEKETHTQVFSCEFCEIFKGTIFTEHLRIATSDFKLSNNNGDIDKLVNHKPSYKYAWGSTFLIWDKFFEIYRPFISEYFSCRLHLNS